MGLIAGPLSPPTTLPSIGRRFFQSTPLVGIGGIATIDDVMEFIVAGASAVQIGTANYYDPTVTMKLVGALPGALKTLGAKSIGEVVGTIRI
jgi:dihydroorotate dehydrogenase (NAD+) catalytic subunit